MPSNSSCRRFSMQYVKAENLGLVSSFPFLMHCVLLWTICQFLLSAERAHESKPTYSVNSTSLPPLLKMPVVTHSRSIPNQNSCFMLYFKSFCFFPVKKFSCKICPAISATPLHTLLGPWQCPDFGTTHLPPLSSPALAEGPTKYTNHYH